MQSTAMPRQMACSALSAWASWSAVPSYWLSRDSSVPASSETTKRSLAGEASVDR